MKGPRESTRFLAAILWLACSAGQADAGFVTSASAIPGPTKVVDFSQLGGFRETTGPVEIGGLVGESISWTATSGLSVIGGSVVSVSYSLNSSFGSNGTWDEGRGGFSGLNVVSSASMTYTFNAGPVSAVGGFINYVPGFDDVTITALGQNGAVLQTYDVSTLAPISTPGAVDAGAFRGIVDATADIYAFRIANSGATLDDLTFSRAGAAVPEPSSAILLGLGLICAIKSSRRRRRGGRGSAGGTAGPGPPSVVPPAESRPRRTPAQAMSRRLAKVVAVVALSCGLGGPAGASFLTVTTVGTPTFRPVDFHLFSAPIGTAADGYAEFLGTAQQVLPEPFYKLDPIVGLTPDQPHPGDDFTADIQHGVQAAGFVDKTSFTPAEFSNGKGVFYYYMLVPGPGAPVGSSLDYASGPIIPNGVFPITGTFDTFYGDGTLADSSGPFTVDVIHPNLGGESHMPFFGADNFDFMDPNLGIAHNFEYRLSIRDAAGNGYDIKADFSVVPEPGSFLLVAIGLVGPTAVATARRGRAPGS